MISVWFWNKYASRPLHILGALGILFCLLGGACGIWSVALFALGYKMSNNIIPPILTVFFIIMEFGPAFYLLWDAKCTTIFFRRF